MEVHFFTEYHGSTEQDYGNIAKGCEEESTIKDDTHQRRGQCKPEVDSSFEVYHNYQSSERNSRA